MQDDVDFGDLFTQAAREAAPLARAKGLGLLFDCQGPALRWRCDAGRTGEALVCLCGAAIDILEDGCVLFTARVSQLPDARWCLAVAAAASGRFAPRAVWQQVLERMQLQRVEQGVDPMANELAVPEWRSARGTCPITGGELEFTLDEHEGSLFSLHIVCEPGLAWLDPAASQPDAQAARAWLIGDSAAGAGSLQRRLQRLGWAVRSFVSVDEAVAELKRMPGLYSRPALVIACEEPGRGVPQDLQALRALLPSTAQLVLAALSAGEAAGSGVELRVQPLSPADLREFTQRAVGGPPVSGQTRPAPLAFEQRKRALVVDDNAVNQLVAIGMLQVLGFEVHTASDGLEAIEHCMRLAPDLVLMDLHMPGMDGLEATRRLRLLQNEGAIPLFPIVASTADTTSQQACEAAGMDGHLCKPLDLTGLEHQLRRLMAC